MAKESLTGEELGDWWDGLTFYDRVQAYRAMQHRTELLEALEVVKAWYQLGPNEHDGQCNLSQGGKYCDCPNGKVLSAIAKAKGGDNATT